APPAQPPARLRDAQHNGSRPRGLREAGPPARPRRRRGPPRVERPRPLLPRRRQGDAPDPRGPRPRPAGPEARGRRRAHRARRRAPGRRGARRRDPRARRGAHLPGRPRRPPGRGRRAPLLRRAHHRGGGRGARPLTRDGQTGVDRRPRLAPPRHDRPPVSGAVPDTARYPRVKALFLDALAQPSPARATWLAAACDDPALRDAVATLLAAHAAAEGSGRLDRPLFDRPTADPADARDYWAGRMVGPWRLAERLGAGGMGTVYRAERADGT